MEPSAKALLAAGVVMAVAAQNAGSACGTVNRQPAHYSSVYSIGALGMRTNVIAGFSSRGPVRIDGSNRRKPDISAPGTNILAADNRGGYSQMSGTSMAAPHVAGCFALLWSAVPALKGKIQQTQAIFEKTALRQSTTECESPQGVPNNVYGYGTIDVHKAYLEARAMGF
jgi:serine protease AprX